MINQNNNTDAKKSSIRTSKSGKKYNSVYGTREWQEKRAEYLKTHPTCEWCGGTTYLSIHHRNENKHEIRYLRRSIEREIVDQLIRREVDAKKITVSPEYTENMGYVCKCGYQNRIKGQSKTSVCNGCGAKNKLSEFTIGKAKNYFLTPQGFKDFLKNYQDEIQEKLKIECGKQGIPAEPTYLDFNEQTVMVICRRCHYAAEHGMDKCPTCSGYKRKGYPVCKKCADQQRAEEIDETEQDEDDDDIEQEVYDSNSYYRVMVIPKANESELMDAFNNQLKWIDNFESWNKKLNEINAKIEKGIVTKETGLELKRELVLQMYNISID